MQIGAGREASGCQGQTEAPTGPGGETGYLVSWSVGHLVELSEPGEYDERYRKWGALSADRSGAQIGISIKICRVREIPERGFRVTQANLAL